MAEKNFFDLLKAKMTALRPSTRHREKDWTELAARLDQALPQASNRRRWPLLVLLLALLASNAWWWRERQADRLRMHEVEAQLQHLQTSVSTLVSSAAKIPTDTVWQTQKVQISPAGQFLVPAPAEKEISGNKSASRNRGIYPRESTRRPGPNTISGGQKEVAASGSQTHTDAVEESTNESIRCEGSPYLGNVVPSRLEPRIVTSLKSTTPTISLRPEQIPDSFIIPYDPPRPFGRMVLNAIKPKYVKVGLVTGWRHRFSPDLKHQLGFEGGVQGIIGFSRHWSVLLDFTFGQLHYESSQPKAILGEPEFSALSSPSQHYAHLNLNRQPLRQFDLGLRYTFSNWGKTRPYAGLQWGNQFILPYSVQYEIEDEPNHTLQEGVLYVQQTTALRNTMRLGAGVEVPISRRFDLTLEGFYQRQWKPKSKNTHSPVGLRLGINRVF